jgi:hypothetical protein
MQCQETESPINVLKIARLGDVESPRKACVVYNHNVVGFWSPCPVGEIRAREHVRQKEERDAAGYPAQHQGFSHNDIRDSQPHRCPLIPIVERVIYKQSARFASRIQHLCLAMRPQSSSLHVTGYTEMRKCEIKRDEIDLGCKQT